MNQIMEVKLPCGNALKRWKMNGFRKANRKNARLAIITIIELGLTKEQILTKYSEKDYLKAEKALNNK